MLANSRAEKLIQFARERFDPELTDEELRVLRAATISLDPDLPEDGAPLPPIRPEFVRWLTSDSEVAPNMDPRGIRIYGVTLPGGLDLKECCLNFPLSFYKCAFMGGIDLRSADVREINLGCCSVDGIVQASGIDVRGSIHIYECQFAGEIRMLVARIKGDLHFHDSKLSVNKGNALFADGINIGGNAQFHSGFTSTGTIRLRGAHISGNLDCRGARLQTIEGEALSGDGIDVGGSVHLSDGFTAVGLVRMRGARIRGVLDCSGAKLEVNDGEAISAHRAEIGGGVYLTDGFTSKGGIGLLYARIGAVVVCSGARLDVKEGDALSLDGAEVMGSVHLTDGFACTGTVKLRGTQIEGTLDCSGAKIMTAMAGDALSADRARIRGDVILRMGFRSSGSVIFQSALIEGSLYCTGAKLSSARGDALMLDDAAIGGNVLLSRGFESTATIRMAGSDIKGQLNFVGAKLEVEEEVAILADGAKIGSDVLMSEGFECSRTVRLHSTQIGGQFVLSGARLGKVDCTNISVSGDMLWMGIRKTARTALDLSGARINHLRDDRESWPRADHLNLNGLVYGELILHERPSEGDIAQRVYGTELPFDPDQRIEWLALQPIEERIEPQPWLQLSRYLESKGNRKGAKHVVYKFRSLRARRQEKWWGSRRWAIFFAWLEEAPLRVLILIIATVVLGTLIFAGADRSGAMIPSIRVLSNADVRPVSDHYPPFQPIVYSLENGLPLVKLGMDDKWVPDRMHTPQPWFPGHHWLDWLAFFNSYWFLAVSRWFLILSGWVEATILAAVVADRFKSKAP